MKSILDLAHEQTLQSCHAAKAERLARMKKAGKIAYARPEASETLAVHPDDIKEAEDSAKAKGVPTSFDSEGRPLFTSARHQQAYCRAYGFYNADSVFSPKHH